ncbi:hypothetical protein [Persicitalea sp.]|uniref:hypothetical protein n=1 Tax=Persicitalea sp. TaxID=3100273 RepID=UPI00359327BB
MKYLVLLLFLAACSRPATTVEYDNYGGIKSIVREKTGFFRVDSTAGRWLFVTPEGHGYFAIGANHTGKFLEDSSQSGPYLARFDGDSTKVREDLYQNYLRLGYNAGEAYGQHDPYLKTKLPYIAHLDYPQSDYLKIDIFDKENQQTLYDHTVAQCQPLRDDKMLIGIAFRDLPAWNKRRMDVVRSLPATAKGKERYLDFLLERYGSDLASLNKFYGSRFSSFSEIGKTEDWKLAAENEKTAKDDADFMAQIAEIWYSTLRRAVNQAAPNHLFLGERHQLRDTPDAVLQVVGKQVDVFLTQALIRSKQRPPEWQTFQPEAYRHEYELTQKPMVIVDWATPFSLGERFDSEHGPIKDEREAVRDIATWLDELTELPFVIGHFKCQFIGSHANDRWFEGKAKRTTIKDDGTDFDVMSDEIAKSQRKTLQKVYQKAKK